MTIKNETYPTKEDYSPTKKIPGKEDSGELPLSDPSESNVTVVFKSNEAKTDEENKPSAFDDNKKNRDN